MSRAFWLVLLAIVSVLALAAIATPFRIGSSPSPPQLRRGAEASSDPAQAPSATAGRPWQPSLCAPEPAGTGPSDLSLAGACAFHHSAALACHSSVDDFYANLQRRLPGGQLLTLYIDVEGYKKPGSYRETVQMLLLVQDGDSLYGWSDYHASMAVGPGEATATVPRTELRPEPGSGASGPVIVQGRIACSSVTQPSLARP